jgi:lysophospholipase L1-like esterase
MEIRFPAAPPIRHPNHFVVLGDSRMAGIYIDSGAKRQKYAGHFFNQANARLGQRMRISGHYAVSGQRSDEFLSAANIAAAKATDAKWALIFGIVNDIGFNISADPFVSYVRPACEELIAAGITPILITDPGSTSLSGNTTTRTAFQRYNALCQQYAAQDRAYGQVLCFDLASLVLDLTTTSIAMKANYSADGTHFTINAAIPLGRAFANFIGPLIPALPVRKVFGGETNALGLQLYSNPGFLSSGGTIGAFSGSLPAGVTNAVVDSGVSCTASIVANADGTNDMQLAMTATQAGRARVVMDLPSGDNAGDLIDLKAQCEIVSGHANLASAFLYSQINRNSASQDFADLYADAVVQGSGLSTAETLDYFVPTQVASGTRGYFTVRFVHYFAGAGTATVKWRHLAVDKRQV